MQPPAGCPDRTEGAGTQHPDSDEGAARGRDDRAGGPRVLQQGLGQEAEQEVPGAGGSPPLEPGWTSSPPRWTSWCWPTLSSRG